MDKRTLIACLILAGAASVLALTSLALADPEDGGADDPAEHARRAVDPDPAVSEPAIAALRALGREGHAALVREHGAAIAAMREGGAAGDPAAGERLRHAVDVVSGQRDGHASGLYWHTDLEAARAEALRTGRPILSLRLLGRLDEELSCANSRYFRVVLYANAAVSRALADRFVLHWSSERPAPRITIDMGDGRRIERTITGNSVHYVIDPAGRVVDAIPGLYAPAQFLAALERAESIARACASGADDAFRACMRDAHGRALDDARAAYERGRAGTALPAWDALALPTAAGDAPSAIRAMPLTVGKASLETPLLEMLARDRAAVVRPDDAAWRAAAPAAELDARSLALVRLKTGRAGADAIALAGELAAAAAADGLRNEATTHRVVHGWLASDEGATGSLEALNARVYRDLFLTPAGDPWLGLRDPQLWDVLEIPR